MANKKQAKLRRGDKAPDFHVSDINGKPVSLSKLSGKKTLLIFFRFASCPLCTVRFTQLLQNYRKYKDADLNIIAVFESSPEYIKTYVNAASKIPFPIIADLEGKLYQQYGVKKSVTGMLLGMARMVKMIKGMMTPGFKMGKPDGSVIRVPADFLIDELGTIDQAYYGMDIGDHIPLKRIDDFIAHSIADVGSVA